jgi:iron(III) transport system substrate-binding protein
MKNVTPVAALALIAGMIPWSASAQANQLNYYCSAQVEWCEAMSSAFSRQTGIRVNMIRRSSGETYAQIQAESSNPRGDVWWGGTGDPHLQAAEEDLTREYRSPRLAELQDWAIRQAEASSYRTVGIYAGALGFGYNHEWLARAGIEAPRCWADLTDARFKGEVQIANPNSSGTAYTTLATFVQLFGEDEGFDLLRALHANINEYTRSGSAPIRAAARGETGVGIVFMHDAVQMAVEGFPVTVVSPCEGTGYEIGSMSLIKGGPNPAAAEAFYDWALSPEAQAIAVTVNAFQVPSNLQAPTPPQAPRLDEINLIDYDFERFGSSQERTRLLEKWDREVHALAR